jgi:hypothetical protein
VHAAPARLARDPARAGNSHAPVEGNGDLVGHEGPPARDPDPPGLVLDARFPQIGDLDLDARRPEPLEASAVDLRVRVADRRDDARDPRLHDRVRAGWRRPVVRARLERDVERRPASPVAGLRERGHLRMRRASPLVPALADDLTVEHDQRADQGMRRLHRAAPSLRELERPLEAHASA